MYLVIITSLILGSYLSYRYEIVRRLLNTVATIAMEIKVRLEYSKSKKSEVEVAILVAKYAVLIESLGVGKYSKAQIKAWTKKFVLDSYEVLGKNGMSSEEIEDLSNVISSLVVHNKEIVDMVLSFKDNEDIKVKEITVLCIEVLGNLYDLSDKLDARVFQHIIYVINMVLLKLRKQGYNKKTFDEIGLILFRLRLIIKSYLSQKKGDGNLTIEDLHKRIDSAVSALQSVLPWMTSSDED